MKAKVLTMMMALLPLITVSSAGERLSPPSTMEFLILNFAQQSCSATGLKASSVRENKATLSFSVKGSRVTGFGVCYGKNKSPSLRDAMIKRSYVGEARDIPMDVSFRESVTDLDTGTVYYARAYIIDSSGKTWYSEEISFTTEKDEDQSYMLNGPRTEYYPNGKIARKYMVKDGVPYGSFKSYNDSGNIVSDQYLVDGVPNGITRTYYSSGQVRSEMNFADGLPRGESREYYENGNLKSENMISGEMDRISSQVKQYYEEGGLRSESVTANGEFVYSLNYDREGRVTSEQKPGSIISYRYDSDGWKHTSINGEKCQCAKCNQ